MSYLQNQLAISSYKDNSEKLEQTEKFLKLCEEQSWRMPAKIYAQNLYHFSYMHDYQKEKIKQFRKACIQNEIIEICESCSVVGVLDIKSKDAI